MKTKVSRFDKKVYQKIRQNIANFLFGQSAFFDSPVMTILDIAPQIHKGAKQFFVKSKIFTADIDEKSGADYIIDICKNNKDKIAPDSFDIIICTEVLEHTLNPFLAIDEIHRLLKPGGHILLSTPFGFRIHGPLPDCWRFTEHGLRALLSKGFGNISINALEDKRRFLMPLHYTVIAEKL